MWSVLKSALAIIWRLVIQYLKGDSSELLLKQRESELATERARIERLEAAAARERAERLRAVDEKAAAVTDAAGADQLLRGVTGSDDPEVN